MGKHKREKVADSKLNPSNPLIATAGALGTEVSRKKRSKKRKSNTDILDLKGDHGGSGGKVNKKSHKSKTVPIQPGIPANVPSADTVPPTYDEAPEAAKTNLAGRPDSLLRSEIGVKKQVVATVTPYNTGNLNTESFFHFVVRSSKNEWIRFRPDALSLTIYGMYYNTTYVAGNADAKIAAQYHALCSRTNHPFMWLDPSVMGSGFFHRVDVSINNVNVPTNSAIEGHFLHYVRANKVFVTKADPHFTRSSQISVADAAKLKKQVMQNATAPFDYGSWDSQTGVRIPVFLDGVFPFDMKSAILESVDNRKEPNLYFPPDTTLEFKFHTYRSKIESIFTKEVSIADYFNKTAINAPAHPDKFTFQDAVLEYESVELHPANHVQAIEHFKRNGEAAIYEYDIPRGQHQALASGASFTENTFQIMPYARFVIVMFLQEWSSMYMENTRRPMSGFSRFPAHCTKIQIGFAGDKNLITNSFNKFGVAGEQNDITKKIFYNYLKQNRLTSDSFEDYFPKDKTDIALNQAFPIDLRSHVSGKTELLTVQCEFAGGNLSPADLHVVVMSIHPNGKASVRSGPNNFSWIWEFYQNL